MKKFSEYFEEEVNEGIIGDMSKLYMKHGQTPHDEAAANKIVSDHKAEFTPTKQTGYHYFYVPHKHVDSFIKHMAGQGIRIGGRGGRGPRHRDPVWQPAKLRQFGSHRRSKNAKKSKSVIPNSGK
jgi:hypothetical protein